MRCVAELATPWYTRYASRCSDPSGCVDAEAARIRCAHQEDAGCAIDHSAAHRARQWRHNHAIREDLLDAEQLALGRTLVEAGVTAILCGNDGEVARFGAVRFHVASRAGRVHVHEYRTSCVLHRMIG